MIFDSELNNLTNHCKEMWETFNSEQFKQEYEEKVNKEELEYQKEKEAFYLDPLHWSNNKRRLRGLNCLRAKINKTREKQFMDRFRWSFFKSIEEVVDCTIGKYSNENEFYGTFVEIRRTQ